MRNLPWLGLGVGIILGLVAGLLLTPLRAGADDAKVALWMEVAHRICTSIGGLGTAVALVFVVRQFHLLRSQTELLQKNIASSMDGELYTRLDSFNKFIVEHNKDYELLTHPFEHEERNEHCSKLHHICDLAFTFYEEIYKHHVRYKLLETEDWEKWQHNMSHFFGKAYVAGYWHTVRARYTRSFQSFANALVAHMQRAKTD
jgi:hypothetical protein